MQYPSFSFKSQHIYYWLLLNMCDSLRTVLKHFKDLLKDKVSWVPCWQAMKITKSLWNLAFRIGCIYLTCLHCVFLNVFSMYLDQRRHNRIGCIGLAFPHCVFSSASSNFLFDTVNTYNGCICLSFSHCAFPNATSNFLDQKCKITLFAFVKMFSTVCIQMYPRMLCM